MLRHDIPHPDAEHDAADGAAQHDPEIGQLQDALIFQVKGGGGSLSLIGKGPGDRPDQEQVVRAAQEGKEIIEAGKRLIQAGRGPHTELGGDEDQDGQAAVRPCGAFLPVFSVPDDALQAEDGKHRADQDLVDVVDQIAIGEVERQLPDVQRDRKEHDGMEKAPLLRGLHIHQQEKQDKERHVPAGIGQPVQAVRLVSHDDQVGGPEITAEQGTEEKDDDVKPSAALVADIAEQAQQKRGQNCHQLDDVLSKIHVPVLLFLFSRFRFHYTQKRLKKQCMATGNICYNAPANGSAKGKRMP